MQEYRQTKVAYIASYIVYRWLLACFTCGIIAVKDYLEYKRHVLRLNEKSLELKTGVSSASSREVFYRNIQGVNVNQSALGQIFNYGDVIITTANQSDSIVFKKVDNPQTLRHAIQDKIQ